MEQSSFGGLPGQSLKDLKGAQSCRRRSPATCSWRTALEASGLKEGEYRLEQLDTAQHLGA